MSVRSEAALTALRRLAQVRGRPALLDVPARRCWLWHAWGMWEAHLSTYQRRRCTRCGKWQERDV